jgi:hypothetical protein
VPGVPKQIYPTDLPDSRRNFGYASFTPSGEKGLSRDEEVSPAKPF